MNGLETGSYPKVYTELNRLKAVGGTQVQASPRVAHAFCLHWLCPISKPSTGPPGRGIFLSEATHSLHPDTMIHQPHTAYKDILHWACHCDSCTSVIRKRGGQVSEPGRVSSVLFSTQPNSRQTRREAGNNPFFPTFLLLSLGLCHVCVCTTHGSGGGCASVP